MNPVHTTSRLRVAQLANFVSPTSGGLRTATNALGRGYLDSGHDRFLIVPGPRDNWTCDENGVTVTLRAPRIPGGYRMVVEPWRVSRVLDRIQPTSVEVSDKQTMTVAAGWAREHGAHSVLFSHEQLDAMVSRRFRWRRARIATINALYRRLRHWFDEIVVTSRFAAAEYLRAGVADVHRIPLGVDLDTFHPNRRPRATDGDEQQLRLAHAGRLSLEKSPDLAVATAVELYRRGVPFRLDVYGDGPDHGHLQRLAGTAPVRFHGHVHGREALAARLAAADVALSVCPGETFGLTILEALACGTPVVTADRGGGRELLTPESGAWAAPDPIPLATAVETVLARSPFTRRRAARRQAERYPWQATVDAMVSVHTRVAPRLTVQG